MATRATAYSLPFLEFDIRVAVATGVRDRGLDGVGEGVGGHVVLGGHVVREMKDGAHKQRMCWSERRRQSLRNFGE